MTGTVYLASWPRSGNTLLRAILWQCFGLETGSYNAEDSMFERNPRWQELTGAIHPDDERTNADVSASQGVCLLKTHDVVSAPRDGTPTIYIIRDGREACVSYWRYYHDILEDRTKRLRDIIAGDCLYSSWSDHVKAWTGRRYLRRPPLPVFRYENMQTHMWTVLRCLGSFLGRKPIASRTAPWSDFHASDPKFFRSGKNDTWRDVMTADDLALFDELHGDTMRECGYISEPKGVEYATA